MSPAHWRGSRGGPGASHTHPRGSPSQSMSPSGQDPLRPGTGPRAKSAKGLEAPRGPTCRTHTGERDWPPCGGHAGLGGAGGNSPVRQDRGPFGPRPWIQARSPGPSAERPWEPGFPSGLPAPSRGAKSRSYLTGWRVTPMDVTEGFERGPSTQEDSINYVLVTRPVPPQQQQPRVHTGAPRGASPAVLGEEGAPETARDTPSLEDCGSPSLASTLTHEATRVHTGTHACALTHARTCAPAAAAPSLSPSGAGQGRVGTGPGQSPIAQCQDRAGSQRSGTRLAAPAGAIRPLGATGF